MRRTLLVLSLIALACVLPPLIAPPNTESPLTETPTATPTGTLPTPVATFTSTPTPAASATPQSRSGLDAASLQLFPWPLYAGDELSVDVRPSVPPEFEADLLAEGRILLAIDDEETFTSSVTLGGFDREPRARFYWITQLPEAAAAVSLTITLELPSDSPEDGPHPASVALSLPLRPRDELPPPEPTTGWTVTETNALRLHYLTGSAAERDLDAILVQARDAYIEVADRLGEADEPVDIFLLDRVVGQGGYASSDWVAISYTDRAYAPADLAVVLRHELVHRLDRAIGCEAAPPILREGLAVYLSGGHYRPEPLREKGAALLGTPHFIPLTKLAQDFYTHQHEVGYLQAATMIQYVVERFGWDGLVQICAVEPEEEGELAHWAAMIAVLGFEETAGFEARWKAWLETSSTTAYSVGLLELELRLMEALRAYQAAYDPSAYFLTAILFSPAEGAHRGIVADFVRRPRDAGPVGIELILAMGQEALAQRNEPLLRLIVEEVETALVTGVDESKLVRDARAITAAALDRGWEPHQLLLDGEGRYTVRALDRRRWPQQLVFRARRQDGRWMFTMTTDGPETTSTARNALALLGWSRKIPVEVQVQRDARAAAVGWPAFHCVEPIAPDLHAQCLAGHDILGYWKTVGLHDEVADLPLLDRKAQPIAHRQQASRIGY